MRVLKEREGSLARRFDPHKVRRGAQTGGEVARASGNSALIRSLFFGPGLTSRNTDDERRNDVDVARSEMVEAELGTIIRRRHDKRGWLKMGRGP